MDRDAKNNKNDKKGQHYNNHDNTIFSKNLAHRSYSQLHDIALCRDNIDDFNALLENLCNTLLMGDEEYVRNFPGVEGIIMLVSLGPPCKKFSNYRYAYLNSIAFWTNPPGKLVSTVTRPDDIPLTHPLADACKKHLRTYGDSVVFILRLLASILSLVPLETPEIEHFLPSLIQFTLLSICAAPSLYYATTQPSEVIEEAVRTLRRVVEMDYKNVSLNRGIIPTLIGIFKWLDEYMIKECLGVFACICRRVNSFPVIPVSVEKNEGAGKGGDWEVGNKGVGMANSVVNTRSREKVPVGENDERELKEMDNLPVMKPFLNWYVNEYVDSDLWKLTADKNNDHSYKEVSKGLPLLSTDKNNINITRNDSNTTVISQFGMDSMTNHEILVHLWDAKRVDDPFDIFPISYLIIMIHQLHIAIATTGISASEQTWQIADAALICLEALADRCILQSREDYAMRMFITPQTINRLVILEKHQPWTRRLRVLTSLVTFAKCAPMVMRVAVATDVALQGMLKHVLAHSVDDDIDHFLKQPFSHNVSSWGTSAKSRDDLEVISALRLLSISVPPLPEIISRDENGGYLSNITLKYNAITLLTRKWYWEDDLHQFSALRDRDSIILESAFQRGFKRSVCFYNAFVIDVADMKQTLASNNMYKGLPVIRNIRRNTIPESYVLIKERARRHCEKDIVEQKSPLLASIMIFARFVIPLVSAYLCRTSNTIFAFGCIQIILEITYILTKFPEYHASFLQEHLTQLVDAARACFNDSPDFCPSMTENALLFLWCLLLSPHAYNISMTLKRSGILDIIHSLRNYGVLNEAVRIAIIYYSTRRPSTLKISPRLSGVSSIGTAANTLEDSLQRLASLTFYSDVNILSKILSDIVQSSNTKEHFVLSHHNVALKILDFLNAGDKQKRAQRRHDFIECLVADDGALGNQLVRQLVAVVPYRYDFPHVESPLGNLPTKCRPVRDTVEILAAMSPGIHLCGYDISEEQPVDVCDRNDAKSVHNKLTCYLCSSKSAGGKTHRPKRLLIPTRKRNIIQRERKNAILARCMAPEELNITGEARCSAINVISGTGLTSFGNGSFFPEMFIHCPSKGHVLIPMGHGMLSWMCNGCMNCFDGHSGSLRCHQCNFDLCDTCVTELMGKYDPDPVFFSPTIEAELDLPSGNEYDGNNNNQEQQHISQPLSMHASQKKPFPRDYPKGYVFANSFKALEETTYPPALLSTSSCIPLSPVNSIAPLRGGKSGSQFHAVNETALFNLVARQGVVTHLMCSVGDIETFFLWRKKSKEKRTVKQNNSKENDGEGDQNNQLYKDEARHSLPLSSTLMESSATTMASTTVITKASVISGTQSLLIGDSLSEVFMTSASVVDPRSVIEATASRPGSKQTWTHRDQLFLQGVGRCNYHETLLAILYRLAVKTRFYGFIKNVELALMELDLQRQEHMQQQEEEDIHHHQQKQQQNSSHLMSLNSEESEVLNEWKGRELSASLPGLATMIPSDSEVLSASAERQNLEETFLRKSLTDIGKIWLLQKTSQLHTIWKVTHDSMASPFNKLTFHHSTSIRCQNCPCGSSLGDLKYLVDDAFEDARINNPSWTSEIKICPEIELLCFVYKLTCVNTLSVDSSLSNLNSSCTSGDLCGHDDEGKGEIFLMESTLPAKNLLDETAFQSSKLAKHIIAMLNASALRIALLDLEFALPRWAFLMLSKCLFFFSSAVRLRVASFLSFEARRSLFMYIKERAIIPYCKVAPQEWFVIKPMSKYRPVTAVDRTKVLFDAQAFLVRSAESRYPAEVEFLNDCGTGKGPTFQFFTNVARELLNADLRIWRQPEGNDEVEDEDVKNGRAIRPRVRNDDYRSAYSLWNDHNGEQNRQRRGFLAVHPEEVDSHFIPNKPNHPHTLQGNKEKLGETGRASSPLSLFFEFRNFKSPQVMNLERDYFNALGENKQQEAVICYAKEVPEGFFPCVVLFNDLDLKENYEFTFYTIGALFARAYLDQRIVPINMSEMLMNFLRFGAPLSVMGRRRQDNVTLTNSLLNIVLEDEFSDIKKNNNNSYQFFSLNGRDSSNQLIQRALTLSNVALIDRTLLHSLETLVQIYLRALDGKKYPERSAQAKKELASLDLTFTLPGNDSILLIPHGNEKTVSFNNFEFYIQLISEQLLYFSVETQVNAFLRGFEDVLPRRALRLLTCKELLDIFTRASDETSTSLWTLDELKAVIVGDHGYNQDSPIVKWLIGILLDFPIATQRQFLEFVTGCPRLPFKGLRALHKITIVEKAHHATLLAPMIVAANNNNRSSSSGINNIINHSASGATSGDSVKLSPIHIISSDAEVEGKKQHCDVDDMFLSVNTCFLYLKIPPYSSKEVLGKRLQQSMEIAGDQFTLS